MKALRLDDIGSLTLCELALPEPAAHEVRLRVVRCALCRTDAKMWKKGQRDLVLPRVLGHEVVGRDEATGESFVVWPGEACGTCQACQAGRQNLCEHMRILGFHRDGGLAEYLVTPRASLVPLPEGIPPEVACLAEPMGCGINALERADVAPDERVLICGGGPVGLLMAVAAKDRGARPLVAEKERSRWKASERFRQEVGIEADTVSDADCVDVAVNAAPSIGCFSDWIPRLRAGGRYCLFSGFSGNASVPASCLNEIHYRELDVVGAYGCTRDQLAQALEIIGRHAQALERLIHERISLERVPGALGKVLAGRAFKFVVSFEPNGKEEVSGCRQKWKCAPSDG